MKCPTCGYENPRSYGPCARCGRFLSAFVMETRGASSYTTTKPTTDYSKDISFAARRAEEISHEDIARKMKMNYQHGTREADQRTLEIILKILEVSRKKNLDTTELLNEAASYIRDQFRLRWVAIGLKDPKDGFFRYGALVGFRDEAAAARRKQKFVMDDFTGDLKYKGRTISEYTRMYFEEDKPYEEGSESTFNRPALLKSRRHSPDDALEADYLDVHIYGNDMDLIGWIETSGTIMGKLPDTSTIKAIEVIASIIGSTLVRERSKTAITER
jgi:hypothetical protein